VQAKPKAGNRRLVNFFKVLIVTVLALPWVIALAVGLNFLIAAQDFSEDQQSYQQRIMQLSDEQEVLKRDYAAASERLVELSEENQALQRTVREAEITQQKLENGEIGIMGASTSGGSRSSAHLNVPSGEQLEELAGQVIFGTWGNCEPRITSLRDAGYDHTVIQQRVNEIIWGR